jgi:Ca2+-binding EF-hand superfamily protein
VDKKKLLTKQRLKTAFGLFDNDGDGSIDINEFKKIF